MEQTESPPPVTVEGDWGPAQTKTVKNKLELYFGSKKKSSGGECLGGGRGGSSESGRVLPMPGGVVAKLLLLGR
ncbi:hypothetical protein KUCAC02_017052 [Chaenocephalus aceratus]|nr:hypothetical protein KUCAC02_017052 [Chaenocephalus aceratus]